MNHTKATILCDRIAEKLRAHRAAIFEIFEGVPPVDTDADHVALAPAAQTQLDISFISPDEGSSIAYPRAEAALRALRERLLRSQEPLDILEELAVERLLEACELSNVVTTTLKVKAAFGPIRITHQGPVSAFQKELRAGLSVPRSFYGIKVLDVAATVVLSSSDGEVDGDSAICSLGTAWATGHVLFTVAFYGDSPDIRAGLSALHAKLKHMELPETVTPLKDMVVVSQVVS